jgi:plasmid stability protein
MQTGSMTSITIRDVPDGVRDELAARARLSGRSLQEYLRLQLVDWASRPDPDVLFARARERTRRTGSQLTADQILAFRDDDRR